MLTKPPLIVQGPFGGGLSTPELVAAVSNGGGLGSYGAHHLAPEEIGRAAASIRERTEAPFALNLWVSNRDAGGDVMRPEAVERLQPFFRELGLEAVLPPPKRIFDFDEQARAVIESRPAVFSFIFGVPSAAILEACARRGIVTAGAATTVAEARALEAAGVDWIVASGFEAGGHRPSFLAPAEDSLHGTIALTRLIRRAVSKPVIAAGGIADGEGVRAVMALGASAAQVGTAFRACEESGAPEIHRRLLFDPASLTGLTRGFSGRLARGIRNRLFEELRGAESLAYPAQQWVVGALREAAIAQGRADLISLWSGQAAGLLRYRRAAELMAALIK